MVAWPSSQPLKELFVELSKARLLFPKPRLRLRVVVNGRETCEPRDGEGDRLNPTFAPYKGVELPGSASAADRKPRAVSATPAGTGRFPFGRWSSPAAFSAGPWQLAGVVVGLLYSCLADIKKP